jgi:transposase
MEIITGVERRRRWRIEDKLRIVAEASAADANVAEIARRYDLSRALVWTWRRQVRRGVLVADHAAFMPMRVVAELPAPGVADQMLGTERPPIDRPVAETGSSEAGRIEITLATGVCIRVIGDVSEMALRRVMGALRS